MDIWQILEICVRRWKITVPLLVAGLVGAWVYSGGVSPTYKAEGSLLYLPPAATVVYPTTAADAANADDTSTGAVSSVVVVQSSNPFASGSLRSAVLAAELYISSHEISARLDDLGLSSSFSATTDRRNAVLYLSAEASSPGDAITTVDELVSVALDDLQRRQDGFGIDQRERVTAQTVTKDSVASVDLGGRTRVRAVLLFLAILLALGAGVATEGFVDHRNGRRPFQRDSEDQTRVGESLTINISDIVLRELSSRDSDPDSSSDDSRITPMQIGRVARAVFDDEDTPGRVVADGG